MAWFDGFEERDLAVARGTIRARVGGAGPPLLLLHGYPQTHLMWRDAAPILAETFTVVAADLPGYGASLRPATAADHAPYSKRAMAADLVEAMAALGHETFAVAGHDRGGRVGYRMALDHPQRVRRLAVLDIVPTVEVWDRMDAAAALGYWHWPFLAQAEPLPEALILGAPGAFFDAGGALGLAGPEAVMAVWRAAFDDPVAVHAFCEDYRAGASIDREHDRADRDARRRVGVPLLALWGDRGKLGGWYDVLAIWRDWADDVSGRAVDASHFLVEDRPAEVARELAAFFAA